ncbi:MAG: alpha/beta hydrolase [Rhizobiaceae bacterium]
MAVLFALAGLTRLQTARIERLHPPIGKFAEVNGTRMHYVLEKAGANADLPPLVFIHGASGNLKDPMLPFLPKLAGRAALLFFDRPGHGWSSLGPQSGDSIDTQAEIIAALMKQTGVSPAVIVAHSFGGSVAASLAVHHPDVVRGLVFLSPATHPWPGCDVAAYYDLTNTPLIGPLFSETLATPAGILRMPNGSRGVFEPNRMPEDYVEDASITLVLRPKSFRANARQVGSLCAHNASLQPHYKEIAVPTVIITGNQDSVVAEEIHSKGLEADIKGSELVWIDGMGHKPDYAATDLAIAAIEKVAGNARDLQAMGRKIEARLKGGL